MREEDDRSMSQIEKLLAVYQIERKLRGLQSSLRTAERFLNEQERQLTGIGSQRESLQSQLRQLQAASKEREGEMALLDERIAKLREQMNTATTNKEYQALLVEVNGQKVERGRVEEETIELLEKIDQVNAELEGATQQHAERVKIRDVAESDRVQRADDIKDRVEELKAERERVAGEVDARTLAALEKLLEERDEDAMASIEVLDKRRHEISCTGCMMTLPVETLNSLLTGSLTNCPSCGCFLYLDEEATAKLGAGAKR
jgi:predicted  nucleic acid-binding Zn-ribbon protein